MHAYVRCSVAPVPQSISLALSSRIRHLRRPTNLIHLNINTNTIISHLKGSMFRISRRISRAALLQISSKIFSAIRR